MIGHMAAEKLSSMSADPKCQDVGYVPVDQYDWSRTINQFNTMWLAAANRARLTAAL